MVTIFLVCHSLKIALNFYDGLFGTIGGQLWNRIAGYVSNFLLILNSSANMIIYCIMNTKFRNHFLSIMKNFFPCTKQCGKTNNIETHRVDSGRLYHAPRSTAVIEMNVLTTCEDSKLEVWTQENVLKDIYSYLHFYNYCS